MNTQKLKAEEAKHNTLISAEELRNKMIKEWENNPIILEIFAEIKEASLRASFSIMKDFDDCGKSLLVAKCLKEFGYKASVTQCMRFDFERAAEIDKQLKFAREEYGSEFADKIMPTRYPEKKVWELCVNWE